MAPRVLYACLLAALLVRGSFAQEAAPAPLPTPMPDMDLVESEDLEALLKDTPPVPATEAAVPTESPATETAAPTEASSAAVETASPAPEMTDSVAPLEPLAPLPETPATTEAPTPAPAVETTTVAPTVPDEDASMAEAVKKTDADLAPLPADVTGDDLDELRVDLRDTALEEPALPSGQDDFVPARTNLSEAADTEAGGPPAEAVATPGKTPTPVNDSANPAPAPSIFDVGREEQELLGLAASIQGQISDGEWNELATQARVSTYTVVKDDWLFKISKRLFGSGFYYPKIWALNPFITNPHLIEPGMVLHFSTGTSQSAPEVRLGAFTDGELMAEPGASSAQLAAAASGDDFSVWGEEAKPEWLNERKTLIDQGVYVQYATGDTLEDLKEGSRTGLIREYENYEPPLSELAAAVPADQYDASGLDRSSRINFKFKEGFHLNTFVTNNPVQDYGVLDAGPDENLYFTAGDRLYIKFDAGMNPLAGDRFSIYVPQGKVSHRNSDRSGFKYSITGQVRLVRKLSGASKWEAELEHASGLVQRGSRITAHTPRIERIIQTFNNRLVEAAVVGTHAGVQQAISYGDVAYLDRGRADGLEMGNVFEVYGFKDRFNGRVIAEQPTYKTGELTIITLTDNFATVLVTNSSRDFYIGDIAVTKTKESALRSDKLRAGGPREGVDEKALEELDVELKVEDLNDSLLDQADKIQLTEDELAELERQEREKSIIKDSERDLKALERLEREIESAEKLLDEAKVDEDKLLEGQSLEELEKNRGLQQQDSLDEIENNLGKRYLDEELNSKDNPYGLTEFDIEEVDDLLNTGRPEGEGAKAP